MEKEFYSEYFVVEDQHWWFIGRRRLLLRILDRFFGKGQTARRILDVGCGTGTMLQYLADYGQAEGADADEAAVRFCRQRSSAKVVQLSDGTLPFPDASFDLVTMLDVLEHIDDDLAAMAEVRRVLRPGGLFVATVPAYRFLWGAQDIISHHKRRYVAAQLKERLMASGFTLDKLSYFNFLLFPPIATIRLFRRLLGLEDESEVKSDFTLTKPGPMNRYLARVFSLESFFIGGIDFPFGVSIVAVSRKARESSAVAEVQLQS